MIESLLKLFAPTPYKDVTDAFQKGALAKVLNSEKPVVVLYPCAHAVGSSVIRAFMGTGIPVLAVDHKPQAAGLYSRLATPLLIPSLRKSEEHFVEEFLKLGKVFKVKPVLIFVDDDDVFLSLKRGDEFKSIFHLPSSDWDVVRPVVDKGLLYRRCQREGFPLPKTWFVETDTDLEKIRSEIDYPAIIKPTFSTRFRQEFEAKARRFDEFDGLAEFAKQLLARRLPFVIQRFIEGDQNQLYTYAACSAQGGDVIMGFTGRKLHQFPPDFGTCRLGESIKDPELERLGKWFLKMTQYKGISLTEFKKGKDGQYYLIESNTRPGGWPERLAEVCGLNIVLAAYKQALGERVEPPKNQQLYGIKWANLSEDLYYCIRGYKLLGYNWAHRGLSGWMADLKGVRTGAFFSLKDPLPSVVRFSGMLKDFAKRERSLK